LKTWRDQ
jgi:hypothetical protein